MAERSARIRFVWIPREENTECSSLEKAVLRERGVEFQNPARGGLEHLSVRVFASGHRRSCDRVVRHPGHRGVAANPRAAFPHSERRSRKAPGQNLRA